MSDTPPLPPVPRLSLGIIEKAANTVVTTHGEGVNSKLPSISDRMAASDARKELRHRKSDLE
jgi:hypothetical protein